MSIENANATAQITAIRGCFFIAISFSGAGAFIPFGVLLSRIGAVANAHRQIAPWRTIPAISRYMLQPYTPMKRRRISIPKMHTTFTGTSLQKLKSVFVTSVKISRNIGTTTALRRISCTKLPMRSAQKSE